MMTMAYYELILTVDSQPLSFTEEHLMCNAGLLALEQKYDDIPGVRISKREHSHG